MKRGIYVLFCLLAVMPAILAGQSNLVYGQQKPTGQCVVRLGDYNTLTFLRKLKIGAAQFVNPALLRTTAVAYEYNLQTLKTEVGSAKLLSLLTSGTGALATVSAGEISVSSTDSDKWAELLSSLKQNELPPPNHLAGVTFIATLPQIGDVSAARQLVSWAAKKPVIPSYASDCAAKK